ncbi:MAG: YhfC family glutamic-type intramembrane protease [Butyrivibrio sp.]|nr:YhfC family glutamic-type intramembrane protease [Butyrivibrio sp.]
MRNFISSELKFEVPEGYDLSGTVPRSTIMTAIIGMLVIFAAGVILFMLVKKREKINGFGFFGGIATYMTFYYLGVSVVANLILKFMGSTYLSILVLALTAAAIPIFGRMLTMKMFSYKMNKAADSLSFGVGIMASEGLVSAINLLMVYVSANTVNKTGVEELLSSAETQEEFEEILKSIYEIIEYKPEVIAGLAVSAIACMVFHIAVSVPLFAAYQNKISKGFYAFCIGTYFAIRLFIYMAGSGFLNVILNMVLVVAGSALFAVTSFRIYNIFYKDEEKDPPGGGKAQNGQVKKKIPRFENLSKL